jgi:hypothetical protein
MSAAALPIRLFLPNYTQQQQHAVCLPVYGTREEGEYGSEGERAMVARKKERERGWGRRDTSKQYMANYKKFPPAVSSA